MSLSVRGSSWYWFDLSSYCHDQIKSIYLDFLDEEQASELVERFAKKKKGKTGIVKGINFFPSKLSITDKGILNILQDIPLFEKDPDLVRVNNISVIAYIAHKFRAEYLWQ